MIFLGVLSMLGFPVFLVWLIVAAIKKGRKKTPAIGLLVCFIVFIFAATISGSSDRQKINASNDAVKVSTNTPAATSPAKQKPKQKTWQKVVDFSGNSIKTTPKFKIDSDEWRIKWTTSPGQYGDMNFQIYLYDSDGNLTGSGVIANVIGNSSDESYVYDKGEFYLTINTAQNYTITVEENK